MFERTSSSSRVALCVYDKFIIGFSLATSRYRNTVLHFLMPIGIFRIGRLLVFVNLGNFAKFLNWEFHNFLQTYRAREFQIQVKHSFLIRGTFAEIFFRRGISISRKLRIFNNYISSIMENRGVLQCTKLPTRRRDIAVSLVSSDVWFLVRLFLPGWHVHINDVQQQRSWRAVASES